MSAAVTVAERKAASLTTRETQVLTYIGKGFKCPEVARLLGIKLNTAMYHVQNLYKKLGINSQAEAGIEAYKRGLV